MKNLLPIALLFLFFISPSCVEDGVQSNYVNYLAALSEPEVILFLEDPSVENAIEESGIELYPGDTPPSLEGKYQNYAEITEASVYYSDIVGDSITTKMLLFNQTESGEISLEEYLDEITYEGIGGYITGEDGYFSLWIKVYHDYSDYGYDFQETTIVVLSGTQLSNGDLSFRGMTTITKSITSDEAYVDFCKERIGAWWMYESDSELISSISSKAKCMQKEEGLPMRGMLIMHLDAIKKSIK